MYIRLLLIISCFQCFKDTKMRANHNLELIAPVAIVVVSNVSKINKLAHIRMDFRGIMQSAWTRKG